MNPPPALIVSFEDALVVNDATNWAVVNLIKDMHRYHNVVTNDPIDVIVIATETGYAQVEEWLERRFLTGTRVFTRERNHVDSSGAPLPSRIVKSRIYRERIAPQEVLFAVDSAEPDIQQAYRSLGIVALGVAA